MERQSEHCQGENKMEGVQADVTDLGAERFSPPALIPTSPRALTSFSLN